MRNTTIGLGLLAIGLAAGGAVCANERQMNVTQGPELVFDQPVVEILPALAGAEATGENGRVGNELVFWGYRYDDGRRVFFFACALLEHVDCPARVAAICPANDTQVLETRETGGKTARRECREVGMAAPGHVRPGCTDTLTTTPLLVGLVACGG